MPEPRLSPAPGDSDDDDDYDSGLDSDSLYSDTTSLSSSVTRYREENGRRYHAYGTFVLVPLGNFGVVALG